MANILIMGDEKDMREIPPSMFHAAKLLQPGCLNIPAD